MNIPGKDKGWIAGVSAAFIASLCCIVPVIAVIGGLSGAASSLSWIEHYRPYLIGTTIIAFAFAWYQKLKPKQTDDCCQPSRTSFTQSSRFLAIVTIVSALLISVPYYAHIFYKRPVQQVQASAIFTKNIQEVEVKIDGMTCDACTLEVGESLSKVTGVITYNTSYDKAGSVIKFDRDKIDIDSIISAINKTGYTVTGVTPK